MNSVYRNIMAAAGTLSCILLTSTVSNAAEETTNAKAPATQSAAKDETNSSPRERGRILVKRNPIASEYQIFGDSGTAAGADADGEGVDFRAFFPQSNPADDPSELLKIGYTLNYNDQSGIGKSGYNISWKHALDSKQKIVMAAQLRHSASDRLIEHYESVWSERSEDGNYYLDRPRFSYDEILTENTVASAQIGYKANDRNSFYFKTYRQDYKDHAYRNRLELQFAGADLIEDSQSITEDGSASEAIFNNASSRRYFGDTTNTRTRVHNSIGGTYTGEEWTVDYVVYMQKWNLDTEWFNWNFTESGLDVGYEIDNPYKPTFTTYNDTNLQNQSNATLSSLRIHDTHTRDRDLAARIDADRNISLGSRDLWIQTGGLHREKEREVWQTIQVYFPSSDNLLYLTDVANDEEFGSILEGYFEMPTGLDPAKGRDAFYNNPEYFAANDYRQAIESAPQSYTAKESVTSAYLLGTQKTGDWTFEIGGRLEHTETETRGTVVIPESVNDADEGAYLETVVNPSNGEAQIIKDLYSENSYDNFIPSAEATYQLSDSDRIKAAWFQLLMRPQYYNIVDYRRISVPTRSISEGNPELSPTSIDKARLSWIRDNETLGSLAFELYYIQIENFFYGSVTDEVILEDGVPQTYRVSRVENGEKANIKGFEIQWNKTINDFAIFDTSTATLAYTYSDSEATVQSRPEDILTTPERSKHLLKLNLSGRIGNYRTELEYAYQSKALDDLGNSVEQDVYREPVVSLSWLNRYSLDKTTSLNLNFANITDHAERSYEGSPIRVTGNQYSSWFGTFNLTKTF
ncbi:TonB-dependent receptor [Pelagicoccus albus]|uniref:Outer membrane beta-barrel protein n=1 Tax=Pelagicoccus albus TaxID=415222 RepID=A0A7X1B8W0_9BACT|nr:TonB-dependent receptor [Pelagicoccus albus]MBC2606510.1 outer membrane beta-barrel protein [Pelagicoccus albus]